MRNKRAEKGISMNWSELQGVVQQTDEANEETWTRVCAMKAINTLAEADHVIPFPTVDLCSNYRKSRLKTSLKTERKREVSYMYDFPPFRCKLRRLNHVPSLHCTRKNCHILQVISQHEDHTHLAQSDRWFLYLAVVRRLNHVPNLYRTSINCDIYEWSLNMRSHFISREATGDSCISL